MADELRQDAPKNGAGIIDAPGDVMWFSRYGRDRTDRDWLDVARKMLTL